MDMVTVPACEQCNSAKSVDDAFFRDFLMLDFTGNESSEADDLFPKVQRSVGRGSSELGRIVLSTAERKPFFTKSGIYLGDFMQAPLDESRLTKVFDRLIRGLFYYYTLDHIPLHYPVEVLRVMPWDMGEAWRTFSKLNLSHCRELGNVFSGSCARVKEDPRSTMWLLSFYRRVHFHVACFNPTLGARVHQ
jgi:hypothetical protein